MAEPDEGALRSERLASKLVGRWREWLSGDARAARRQSGDRGTDWAPNNDFRYASDPRGEVCPMGSHIAA